MRERKKVLHLYREMAVFRFTSVQRDDHVSVPFNSLAPPSFRLRLVFPVHRSFRKMLNLLNL